MPNHLQFAVIHAFLHQKILLVANDTNPSWMNFEAYGLLDYSFVTCSFLYYFLLRLG